MDVLDAHCTFLEISSRAVGTVTAGGRVTPHPCHKYGRLANPIPIEGKLCPATLMLPPIDFQTFLRP